MNELVKVEPQIVRSDGSDGRVPGSFAPGHSGGLKKGHKHKITEQLRREYVKHAEENGEKANPLIVLAKIMADDGVQAAVRVQAAGRLAQFLLPKQMSMDALPDGALAEETLTVTRKLRQYFALPEDSNASL